MLEIAIHVVLLLACLILTSFAAKKNTTKIGVLFYNFILLNRVLTVETQHICLNFHTEYFD